MLYFRPSKLLAPAKIQWSKPEYGDEQEPPWGTSAKPPEPLDSPKQSSCKCVNLYMCVLSRIQCVFLAWYLCENKVHKCKIHPTLKVYGQPKARKGISVPKQIDCALVAEIQLSAVFVKCM